MLKLSPRQTLATGAALVALMAVTRSSHIGDWSSFPDASWAIFFLAGMWLAPRFWLPLLIAFGVGIDWFATSVGGVSDYCMTPAYWFMLPAYAALWGAGRFVAGRALPAVAAGVVGAAVAAEVLSGGSFYFLSGYQAAPTLAGYAAQFGQYFPTSLAVMAAYTGVALLVSSAFKLARPAHG